MGLWVSSDCSSVSIDDDHSPTLLLELYFRYIMLGVGQTILVCFTIIVLPPLN